MEPSQDNEEDSFLGLDIHLDQIEGLTLFAEGATARCHRGILRGRPVVVKIVRGGCKDSETFQRDIEKELNVLRVVQHPYIVGVVGAGRSEEGDLFLVLEDLSGGTLSSVMGTDTAEGSGWLNKAFVRTFRLPMVTALKHGLGVASALHYMHETAVPEVKVLHRDVKSSNLAFALDGKLKLFDFGLARFLRESDKVAPEKYKMTGMTGSLRYMAPEVALGQPSNEKVDVHSFGCILWEMLSIQRPFEFYKTNMMWERVIIGGERPRLDPAWPQGLRRLLSRCWARSPDDRPSMKEVRSQLEGLINLLESRS